MTIKGSSACSPRPYTPRNCPIQLSLWRLP